MAKANLDTGNFMDLISGVQGGEFEYVDDMPVDNCYPDLEQPRYKNLNAEGVADITATFLVTKGRIWQPIVVREEDDKGHKILMGGRRWLAVKLYGEPTIPVLIVKKDIDSALFLQLMENIARKPLDVREEGRSFITLKETGKSQREIAASLNYSESYITEAIMMSDMETDPALAFLNKLYEDEICQDISTLAVLVRLARKDAEKTKALVKWAIDNDSLNRRWAKSLSVKDLDVSSEQKIADLEERVAAEKRKPTKTQPLSGMTGSGDDEEDFALEQEQDGSDVKSGGDKKPAEKPTPAEKKGKESSEEEKSGPSSSELDGSTLVKKRVTSINVTHDGRVAKLLLDGCDKEEGFAWIQYELDGDTAPVRVDVTELSLIFVG